MLPTSNKCRHHVGSLGLCKWPEFGLCLLLLEARRKKKLEKQGRPLHSLMIFSHPCFQGNNVGIVYFIPIFNYNLTPLLLDKVAIMVVAKTIWPWQINKYVYARNQYDLKYNKWSLNLILLLKDIFSPKVPC